MRLLHFVGSQYRNAHHDITDGSLEQLLVVARLLERQFGREITTQELSLDLASQFVAWLAKKGRSQRTIKGRLSTLLSIWREAERSDLSPAFPERKRIPVIRCKRRTPRCWRIEQFATLVGAASRLDGQMQNSPVARSAWWTSLLLFLYDSGSRVGAALQLRKEDVDLERRCILLDADNAKTGLGQVVTISDQTAAWLAKVMQGPGELVWPNVISRTTLWRHLNDMLESVGLPTDRRSKFHKIRRTHATYLAICASLAAAQRSVGHTSAKMTMESYIDPTLYREISAANVIPRPEVLPQE